MQPEQFGPYTLLERLGIGGMAEVYLAHTRGGDGAKRKVAIKRLLYQHSQDRAFVSMFADEARISARLVHPNIAQVFDFGEVDDRSFIAMEYVEGKDLPDVISRYEHTGMPVPMTLYIARGVAEALSHAHEMRGDDGMCLNIVHRDISPQNVLVAYSGEVKLIDFGIAKAKNRLEETVGGVVKGKFAYMSPEQVEGGQIDGRSDVFSLGIVLWEMLAGMPLFMSENALTTASRVLMADIPPLVGHNPEATPALDAVVQRALARKREDRFQSAGELARALTELAESGHFFTQRDMAQWMRDAFRDIASLDSAPLGFGDDEDETRADLSAGLWAERTTDVQSPPPAEPARLTAPSSAPVDVADLAETIMPGRFGRGEAFGAGGAVAVAVAPAPPQLSDFDDDEDAETRADLRSYTKRRAEMLAQAPTPDALAQADTPIDQSLELRMAAHIDAQATSPLPRLDDPRFDDPRRDDPRPGAGLDALPTRLHADTPRAMRDAATNPLPRATRRDEPPRLATPQAGARPAQHAGVAAPSARRADSPAPSSSLLWYWLLLGGIVVVGALAATLLLVL